MKNKYRRRPILVTGLPRSGTSLIAGLLHEFGAWTGTTLAGDEYNPKGYFEHAGIREDIVKPMLKVLGGDENGVKMLPVGALPADPEMGSLIVDVIQGGGRIPTFQPVTELSQNQVVPLHRTGDLPSARLWISKCSIRSGRSTIFLCMRPLWRVPVVTTMMLTCLQIENCLVGKHLADGPEILFMQGGRIGSFLAMPQRKRPPRWVVFRHEFG